MTTCRILLAVFLFSSSAIIQAEDMLTNNIGDTALGIGYALVRFDTSFNFKDKIKDQSVFVDAEGTLGLPDWDSLPVLYGNYRISKRHAIGFSYFRIRRESSLFNFDGTLDDVHISGYANFSDDTQFLNAFYAYNLYEDSRSLIQSLIGINALDIRYVLNAKGTITYEDSSTDSTYKEDAGVFAPMPLIGVDLWYAFTPKWSVSSRVSLVAGNFDDYRGWVVNTNINTRYQFAKHVGAVFGLSYFDADITIEDALERTDVNYSYDGIFLGIHGVF